MAPVLREASALTLHPSPPLAPFCMCLQVRFITHVVMTAIEVATVSPAFITHVPWRRAVLTTVATYTLSLVVAYLLDLSMRKIYLQRLSRMSSAPWGGAGPMAGGAVPAMASVVGAAASRQQWQAGGAASSAMYSGPSAGTGFAARR